MSTSSLSSSQPKAHSPPQLATPTTTTTSVSASASTTTATHTLPPSSSSAAPSTSHSSPPPSSSNLPTSHSVSEARAAVIASLSNMLDRKLQTRASTLHSNAAALSAQERDVEKATAGLRREREKLEREAARAERSLREIGSVQNWAEVLEREFLVLEETVRLANGRSSEDGRSGNGSWSGSCSCSECGDEDEGRKKKKDENEDVVMGEGSGWSEASRSLMDGEESTGTGTGTAQTKGSESTSISTLA